MHFNWKSSGYLLSSLLDSLLATYYDPSIASIKRKYFECELCRAANIRMETKKLMIMPTDRNRWEWKWARSRRPGFSVRYDKTEQIGKFSEDALSWRDTLLSRQSNLIMLYQSLFYFFLFVQISYLFWQQKCQHKFVLIVSCASTHSSVLKYIIFGLMHIILDQHIWEWYTMGTNSIKYGIYLEDWMWCTLHAAHNQLNVNPRQSTHAPSGVQLNGRPIGKMCHENKHFLSWGNLSRPIWAAQLIFQYSIFSNLFLFYIYYGSNGAWTSVR